MKKVYDAGWIIFIIFMFFDSIPIIYSYALSWFGIRLMEFIVVFSIKIGRFTAIGSIILTTYYLFIYKLDSKNTEANSKSTSIGTKPYLDQKWDFLLLFYLIKQLSYLAYGVYSTTDVVFFVRLNFLFYFIGLFGILLLSAIIFIDGPVPSNQLLPILLGSIISLLMFLVAPSLRPNTSGVLITIPLEFWNEMLISHFEYFFQHLIDFFILIGLDLFFMGGVQEEDNQQN